MKIISLTSTHDIVSHKLVLQTKQAGVRTKKERELQIRGKCLAPKPMQIPGVLPLLPLWHQNAKKEET